MRYHCLDFEASSLDLTCSWPIQVAWSVGDTVHSHLVKPHDDWQDWDDNSYYIHRIEREKAEREGQAVSWLAEAMNRDLADRAVFVTAPLYDGFWLRRLFSAAGIEPAFELANFGDLFGRTYPVLEDRAWRITAGMQHDAAVDVEHMLNMLRLKLGLVEV